MTDETNETGTDHRLSVSRRTVVKGAAWSVPAIVIASQAPAMAASPPVVIDFSGSSLCKIPGSSFKNLWYDKGYVFWGKFINTTGSPIYLKIWEMYVGGQARCLVGVTPAGPGAPCPPTKTYSTCIQIPVGTSYIGIFTNDSTDSSSTYVTIDYSWHTEAGCTAGSQVGREELSGTVVGGSWTTEAGGGSCKFPPGHTCYTPLDASGSVCGIKPPGS